MEDFAKYTKNSDSSATINLASLGILLNINHIDLSGKNKYKKDKKGSGSEDEHAESVCTDSYCHVPEWNYDQHGDDWPDKYPNCALSHQSPINLIDPITEYGQTYNIMDYADDGYEGTYWSLENSLVMFDLSKYSIDVYIDHSNGYAGFETKFGHSYFKSDFEKWDAYEFIIHSPSDHTVNGVRYDLEIQIYHLPHITTLEEDGFVGEEGAASSTHRRMQGDAAAEEVDEYGGHGDKDPDDPLQRV
jgi:hypothetical protein